MELREQLSEAREAKDLARAQKMADEVTAKKNAALAEALAALSALEAGKNAAELEKASHQLARVRYFTRFLEEVEAMEEEALG